MQELQKFIDIFSSAVPSFSTRRFSLLEPLALFPISILSDNLAFSKDLVDIRKL